MNARYLHEILILLFVIYGMDKKHIIDRLKKSRIDLEETIYMVENDQNCLQIHIRLKKIIYELEKAKKELLNQYLDKCLSKLCKNTELGIKTRNDVINIFQT